MSYCGNCGKVCEMVQRDMGIGPYEFWGRKGFDSDLQWVSECCEATVYENEDLTIEDDDYPDPEADRGDYLYDLSREG